MNATRFSMSGIIAFGASCALAFCQATPVTAFPIQESIAGLKTVAEDSDYKATSDYSQVVDFVDQCCVAEHVTRYDFGQSVEGRAMIAAVIADPPFDINSNAQDDRLRILLLGNIHSGECAGKEALLAMLRELASSPQHPWLSDCVIVIAPNYNVDANERVGLYQRRGQVGPEKGMGQRENAMQLDLNRDFCKLESPEARSLVGLIDQFDPHMFIDCHTTNGSQHQYVLTYDIPHNPTTSRSIRDYLRNNMMKSVTRNLEEKGVLTFYYGNFSQDHTRWTTYGHEPRYSTEYVGLRGRLGILSEAYSYATYRQRIEATDAFVRECVEHVRTNSSDIKSLLDNVRHNQQPNSTLVHLNSEMAPFPGKFRIRGLDGDQKKDYEVTFFGDYKPVVSVIMPEAYAIPPDMSMLAERMRMHGVEVEILEESNEPALEGKAYRVKTITRNPRRFQKHNMVTLEVAAETETVPIEPRSYIIRTRQPLGRLVSYMLEPETNEGLVTWNLLDPWLHEGKNYPIYRIETQEFATTTVNEIEPTGRLRLSDIFGPEKTALSELSLDQVQWMHDGKSYSVEKNGRRVSIDAQSGGESSLPLPFEIGDVTAALNKIDGPNRRELLELIGKGVQLRTTDQNLFVISYNNQTFVFDSLKQKAIRLGDDNHVAELADLNPAGNQVAFVLDNNLMLLDDIDAEPTRLTFDGSDQIFNGKLDWVYQEELYGRGNFKGFWWSPNGESIAYLRTNESPVHFYTVTDHLPVRGQLQVTAYPKAGDPLPTVTLAVIQPGLKKTVWAKLPARSEEPLQELLISRVTWDPSSDSVLVQLQNRIQSWLDLCRLQPETGELNVLFRDQTPAWIKTPGDPVVLRDGSFLWMSPRSGFNSIYRYSAEGTELARLTNENWEVRTLNGCDFAKQVVYFTGSPETPTRVTPMRVNLDGTDMTKLVDMPGVFSLKFNKDLSWFLAEHSSVNGPAEILLFDSAGQPVRNVLPYRDDHLRHLALEKPEFVQIPIGEEDEQHQLDVLMIRPIDFDASRKYPVVVHVYGGPQTPRVVDRFGGQNYLWHQYLAQQGFVVLIVDNRSCSYRSAKQAWPVYRDLARRELADVEWAVNWLKTSHAWVDEDRIGLWGWSYGGYMTAYALTHSKLFRCGIAGAPVTDWKNYDAIYTERYMDTPQANEKGYQDSSVITSAPNLHGELLLIHGTIDDNVHISNTIQFASALQKAGKQFELMVYPGNRHAVSDPAQRLHLYRLMTGFLTRNLK